MNMKGKIHIPLGALGEQSCLNVLPQTFIIQDYSFKSDVVVDQDELVDILMINRLKTVSREDLWKGIQALKEKQKFSFVDLEISHGKKGVIVGFTLHSEITVRKVILKGAFAR